MTPDTMTDRGINNARSGSWKGRASSNLIKSPQSVSSSTLLARLRRMPVCLQSKWQVFSRDSIFHSCSHAYLSRYTLDEYVR